MSLVCCFLPSLQGPPMRCSAESESWIAPWNQKEAGTSLPGNQAVLYTIRLQVYVCQIVTVEVYKGWGAGWLGGRILIPGKGV